MVAFNSPLPIDEALPELISVLGRNTCAVLVAPPGAGKTTRVPLALLDQPFARAGKILVLEPRRPAPANSPRCAPSSTPCRSMKRYRG